MRPRRKKWTKELLQSSQFVISNDYPVVQWSKQFPAKTIHLEIGAGKGDYWQGMASLYPDDLWVALEKNDTVAGIAIKKMETSFAHLKNAKLLQVDAIDLPKIFAPHEVDVIHLNFSDPWPKSRHEKRRLTSPEFQAIYLDLLTKDGLVIQKTDNVSLFNYSLVAMNDNFKLIEVDVDFRSQPHDEDVFTEYEQKFHGFGQPIFRAVYQRRSEIE